MGAIWTIARAQARGRWLSTFAVALLIALGAGTAMAAIAGVRRADHAVDEFLDRAQAPAQANVVRRTDDEEAFHRDDQADTLATMQALPSVRSATRNTAFIVQGQGRRGAGPNRRLLLFAALDPGLHSALGNWSTVAGRDLDEQAPDEVVVSEGFAAREGLRPGSTYRIGAYTLDQFGPAGEGLPIPPDGPSVDLKVVGIARTQLGLVPGPIDQDNIYTNQDELYVGAGFWKAHGPDLARYGVGVAVVLDKGVSPAAFADELDADFGDRFEAELGSFQNGDQAVEGIRRAIAMEGRALLVFALVAALATLAIGGQALNRQLAAEAQAVPAYHSLGLTRRSLVGAFTLRFLPTAVMAGLGAGLVAIALSPFTPVGVGGRAELHRGVAVDGPVMLAGASVTIVAAFVVVVVGSWSIVRARGGTRSAARVPSWQGAFAHFPVALATGFRLAFSRVRGAAAPPVRTAATVTAVAALAVAALAGTAGSFDALVAHPARYGVNWDVSVGNFAGHDGAEEGAATLEGHHEIAAFAGLNSQVLSATHGHWSGDVATLDFARRKGRISPVVTAGRSPTADDEVAVGSVTMRRLHLSVGDQLMLRGPGDPRPFHVVGQAVLNDGAIAGMQPGKGALLTSAGMKSLDPEATDGAASQVYLVRFVRGVDHDAAITQLRDEFPETVVTPFPATDISNLRRIASLPTALGVVLAVLGMGAVGHAVALTVRRRRIDLAVLRGLGFRSRDIAAAVAAQASALEGAGLVVGLPLGAALGRVGWRLLATQLGVASAPVTPGLILVGIALAAVVIANVAAAGSIFSARRLRAAEVLRTPD